MRILTMLGAGGFALWGLLHIAGAGMILVALWSGGAAAGYVIYGVAEAALPAATGGVLGYFAYVLLLAGLVVLGIAVRVNTRNSEAGLAINTGIVAAVELGLVLFLLVPGYLPLGQAWPGFLSMAVGVTFGGMACKGDPAHAEG